MVPPSKATPTVKPPAGKLVGTWFAGYQCRRATCRGFLVELTTPLAASRPKAAHKSTAKTANFRFIDSPFFGHVKSSPLPFPSAVNALLDMGSKGYRMGGAAQ